MMRAVLVMVKTVAFAVMVASVMYAQPEHNPDTERRLQNLESIRPDARITAMETRLDNIERINVGIFMVVMTQLAVSALQLKLKRPNDNDE